MIKTAAAAAGHAFRRQQRLLMLALFFLCLMPIAQAATLTVLAAASTTDAMKEAAALFAEQTGHAVRFSFASSGALARQIQSGGPADLFLSANQKWMDALEKEQLIDPATRTDLLKNRLVLIALKGQMPALNKSFSGRLAVGDIRSVPAGMYAAEALKQVGLFDTLRSKMVMASSVRGALMFVERGEVDAGIVYATDAKISSRVEIASVFPEESHSPIRYPAAVCRASRQPELARGFLTFLKSTEANEIFDKYGFER